MSIFSKIITFIIQCVMTFLTYLFLPNIVQIINTGGITLLLSILFVILGVIICAGNIISIGVSFIMSLISGKWYYILLYVFMIGINIFIYLKFLVL